jgi:hypothetical protein
MATEALFSLFHNVNSCTPVWRGHLGCGGADLLEPAAFSLAEEVA